MPMLTPTLTLMMTPTPILMPTTTKIMPRKMTGNSTAVSCAKNQSGQTIFINRKTIGGIFLLSETARIPYVLY